MAHPEASRPSRPGWLRRRWPLLLFWVGLIAVLAIVNYGNVSDNNPSALDRYIDRVLTVPIWSPIATFVRRNQSGLLASLLVSFMLEVAGQQRQEYESLHSDLEKLRDQRTDEVLRSMKPAEAVGRALERRYGSNRSVASLVNAVVSERDPFWDAILRYNFSAIPGDDEWYRLEVTREYSLTGDSWLLCLTSENAVHEAVAAAVPHVCELMSLSEMDEAASVIADYRISLLTERQGVGGGIPLTMKRVRAADFLGSGRARVAIEETAVQLWQGKFPPDARRHDGTYRVVIRFKSRMKIDDHSFHWMVDRPLHALEVEFDARRFGGEDGSRRFYTVYLLQSSVDARDFQVGPGHYVMRLHRWLPQGNGVVLVWRDR